jgi:hypothetical protein
MDTTLGDVEAFTEGTVTDVLEAAREVIRASDQEALRVEQARRMEAEQQVMAAQTQTATAFARIEANRAAQIQRIGGLSSAVGRVVAWLIALILISALASGAYVALPAPFPPLRDGWWQWISPGLLALSALASLWSFVTGSTIRSLANAIEQHVAGFIKTIIARLVGIDPS